jgi:hypothetical protein
MSRSGVAAVLLLLLLWLLLLLLLCCSEWCKWCHSCCRWWSVVRLAQYG